MCLCHVSQNEEFHLCWQKGKKGVSHIIFAFRPVFSLSVYLPVPGMPRSLHSRHCYVPERALPVQRTNEHEFTSHAKIIGLTPFHEDSNATHDLKQPAILQNGGKVIFWIPRRQK